MDRYTLVHLTDLHLVPEGELLRGTLDTFAVFDRILDAIERSGLAPAALVLSGDLAEAGEPGAYERLRKRAEELAATGVRVVPAMGNHDDRAAFREALLGGAPGTAPVDYAVRIDGLRIAVLDSTVPGHHHGELSPAQLAWLDATLAEPAPDGTVLVLHHPPLPALSALDEWIELRDRAGLARVIAGRDVRLVLAGHTHVIGGGSLAGVPVWTGGTTAFASDPLSRTGGRDEVLLPVATRIELTPDGVVIGAIAVDAPREETLAP